VLVLDEAQAGEVLDLGAVDAGGPLPVEGVELLERGQAGGFDAPFGAAFLSGEGFAVEEFMQVFQCGRFVSSGPAGGGPRSFGASRAA